MIPGLGRSAGEGIGYPLQYSCGSAGKEFACNAGNLGSSPGLGRSPGEGKGYPLQYSGLDNSMDYGVSIVVQVGISPPSPIEDKPLNGTEIKSILDKPTVL